MAWGKYESSTATPVTAVGRQGRGARALANATPCAAERFCPCRAELSICDRGDVAQLRQRRRTQNPVSESSNLSVAIRNVERGYAPGARAADRYPAPLPGRPGAARPAPDERCVYALPADGQESVDVAGSHDGVRAAL